MKRGVRAGVSIFASAALAASMCALPTSALAAGGLGGKVGSETNWTVPSSQMDNTVEVDGKLHKVITTWANAWALSGPDYLGVSNSGPLNQQGGGAGSTELANAQNNTLLGIWASEANEVPNAYNWNYFYNLKLAEDGSPLVDTAAIDVQNSSLPGFDSESGVWAPFKYRPEIIWTSNSLDANGVATYTKYIREGKYYDGKTSTIEGTGRDAKLTNPGEALDKDQFYIDGDEDYNPQVISANNNSAYTFTESFYELADMTKKTTSDTASYNADGAVTKSNVTWKTMNALPRTTRYEASAENAMSAEECALAIEKISRGAVYYTLSQIDAGAVDKKKVAFLTGDPADGTATVVKYDFIDQIGGGPTGGKTNTASLVVDQLTGSKKVARTEASNSAGVSYTTYTVTADNLARCDYVVDANGSMTAAQLQAWVKENASSDANKKRAEDSVQYLTNSPAIMNGHNFTTEKMIWGAFNIDFFYPELWPNMELTTYWYDNIYHLKSSAVKTAMEWGLANASLPEETSLPALGNGYSASDIDDKVSKGVTWFASVKDEDPYNTTQFKTLLPHEDLAAMQKSASDVVDMLKKLSGDLSSSDAAAVVEAQTAYNALDDYEKSVVDEKLGSSATEALKTASSKVDQAAKAEAAAAADKKAQSVKTVTVNVATVNAAAVNKAVAAAGGSSKYVTTIVLGSKVKKISASAFKSYTKVKTLQVKSTKLKKAGVKNSLKGSAVKTVKVPKAKKKAYKKIFTKKIAGAKVSVK